MSRTHNNLFRNLGLEDLVEEETSAVEENLSGEDTVEADLLEVGEAEEEVENHDEQMDDLTADAETLEEVKTGIEDALANGGMDRQAARFAQITVDRIQRRWGLEKPMIPSMEDFGNTNSKVAATRISMESIGETLSKMWKAIWAKLVKMWESLKGWVIKITDTAPGLKARAEALIKKASEAPTGPMGAKIPASTFKKLNELHIGGKAPSAADFKTAMADLVTVTTSILSSKYGEAADAAVAALLEGVEKAASQGKGREQVAASIKVLASKIGGFATVMGATTTASRRGAEGSTTKITKELPGGQCFLTSVPFVGDSTASSYVSGVVIAVAPFSTKKVEITANGEFETLNAENVKAVAGEVVKLATQLSAHRTAWQSREAAQKKMNAAVEKAAASVEKKGEPATDDSKAVRDGAVAASNLWRKTVSFDVQVVSYAFKTARAALAYCDRSLGNKEKAAKEKPKKEEAPPSA